MKTTHLLSFVFSLLCVNLLYAQTQTIQVTVTNGSEIRCAADNTVNILITPNPTLTWTQIQLDWGDGSLPVTILPNQALALTHTYSMTTLLSQCAYNCASSFYNGACFTVSVLGTYVAPAPQENVSKVLTFKRPPTANFTVPTPICLTDMACVTPSFCPSNDNTSVFSWNLGNGNTFLGNTPPCFSYVAAGTYTISVTHTNMCGTATHPETLVVIPPPLANATPNPIIICDEDTAFLIGNTSQNTNTYLWTVTPGTANVDWKYVLGTNPSTNNPKIKFSTPGFYTAVLTASNNPCPIDQDSISIQVDAPINMSINPKQANVCNTIIGYSPIVNINLNANATLNDSLYNGTSFVPFTPPINLSASTTPKIIKVTATNACGRVSKLDTFYVKPIPTAVATATSSTTICSQDTVFFSGANSVNALSYSWAVSPGINGIDWSFVPGAGVGSVTPKIIFTTINTYTVTLYVNNSPCPVVASNPITVNMVSANTLTLNAQADVCAPFSYTPLPATVGASYTLKLAPNTPISSPYNNLVAGTYYVMASLTNICGVQVKNDTFVVHAPVTACFPYTGNDTICLGTTLTFDGTCSQNETSYMWNNNAANNLATFSYTFNTGGYTTIALTADNAGCPSDNETLTLFVFNASPLTLNAQADVCAPFSYTPLPATLGASYTLKLAPNTPISSPYNNLVAGTYYVTASLTNLCGVQVKNDTFVVHAPVTACFPYTGNDTICLGTTLTFDGTCSQNETSYIWNNSAANNLATFSYTFNTGGYTTIALTADNAGCPSDNEILTLFVENAPSLTLNAQADVCAPFSYTPLPATVGASYTLKLAPNTPISFPYNNLSAGMYYVTASLINICGTQIKNDTFVVHASVTACFPYTGNDTICLGASLTFDGTCSQNETSYMWNNNAANNLATFSYTFNTGGYTTITLTADNAGCPSDNETLILFVENVPSLTLNAQADVCAPFSYTPLPATVGASYTLKLAPNTPISFPYNNLSAGTYCVTASLTNICGVQVKNDTFVVHAPVTACFPYTGNDTICLGTSLTFDGTCSQNETSYIWNNNAANNLATFSYTFNTGGYTTIALTADNAGCPSDNETLTLFVENVPSLTLNAQADVCAPFSYTPLPATVGASYTLKLAPNTPISFPYNNLSAGTYCVTASLTNICGVQVKNDTFVVHAPVTACFPYTGNDTICLGTTLTFDGTCSQNETSYMWNNNAANNLATFSYTFNTLGNATITLTADNPGCPSDNETLTLFVEDAPILSFLPQSDACLVLSYSPQPQYYSLATYKINGNIISSFPYNMTQAGSPYYIEASIANSCTSYVFKDTIVIFGPVNVNIVQPSVDTLICQNASLNLLVQPNDGAGNWWLNGNIIPANYTFPTTGFYEIIYIRGAGACETRDTVHIEVQEITVSVQDTSVCQNGNSFPLTVAVSPSGGNGYWYANVCPTCITNAGLLQIPIFPANLTTLPVIYVYQSLEGCKDSATLTITNVPIHADFTFVDDTPCTFEMIDVNTNAAVFSSVLWEIDGIVSSPPPFAPLSAGIHTIEMFAIVGNCIDSMSRSIVVTPIPSPAIFTPSTDRGCPPLEVVISRGDTTQTTVSYSWNFGRGANDNFVGFLPPNTLIYPNTTDSTLIYSITVLAENFCGTAFSDTTIFVFPLPFAKIGIDSTQIRCSPFKATFTNRSTGLPTQAIWDFGDGTAPLVTLDSVVFHTFYAPDSIRHFTIRLIAINDCGADTAYQSITVIPPYIDSYFTLDNYKICPNTPIYLQDASTPAASSVFWDFGDGNTSNDLNPTHVYLYEDTTLFITLYSTNTCGYDSLKRSIKILPSPKPNFSFPILNCQNQFTQFNNLSAGNYTYSWDFGDGSGDSTQSSPSHLYAMGGATYYVTLFATAYPDKCVGKITKPIEIRPQPIADFEVSSAKNCYPSEQILFTNTSQFANTYTWYFGDGTTWQNAANANTGHDYTHVGQYNVTLIATYHDICIDSMTQFHAVTMDFCEYYIPNVFTPNGDGHNDLFLPIGYNIAKVAYLQIFDRWGKIVYEEQDIPANGARGWDGTLKNAPAPEGMYVYKVQMEYIDGSLSEERYGDVTLVR